MLDGIFYSSFIFIELGISGFYLEEDDVFYFASIESMEDDIIDSLADKGKILG
jgi:hypothetical protein